MANSFTVRSCSRRSSFVKAMCPAFCICAPTHSGASQSVVSQEWDGDTAICKRFLRKIWGFPEKEVDNHPFSTTLGSGTCVWIGWCLQFIELELWPCFPEIFIVKHCLVRFCSFFFSRKYGSNLHATRWSWFTTHFALSRSVLWRR